MKKLVFFTSLILIALTSCTLEDRLAPLEEFSSQDAPESDDKPAIYDCSTEVVYYKDDETPCGFYFLIVREDFKFVPEEMDLLEGISRSGTRARVQIEEDSYMEGFCGDLPSFAISCVSMISEKGEKLKTFPLED